MANIIIPNQDRKADADHIMKSYGCNPNNREMREAAECMAAKTNEAIKSAENHRRYY